MRCVAPIQIKNPSFYSDKSYSQDKMISVRCGSCEGCIKSRINDWAFRLEQEAKIASSVFFVTLTYSPEYVPLTAAGLPTLSKRDVQLFMKRLRKLQENAKLRYFAVGEYGSRTYRPHYHLILFNVEQRKQIFNAWSKENCVLGGVHIGHSISDGAVPYTLKYMYKKGLVPAFDGDDRMPEFRLMSNKLGANYLTPAMKKWHLKDLENRLYVQFRSGIKVAIPRYYREKLIEMSGKPKSLFNKSDQSIFMTHEDDDYRTLKSRLDKKKRDQAKFIYKRNQVKRDKI